MQQPQMQSPMNGGPNGGMGITGVLIDNRFAAGGPNTIQPQMDFNYANDMKGQKVQRRPSTNKLSHDQNSIQN